MPTSTPLTATRLAAEALYILRPAVHLLAMLARGTLAWSPWVIGLLMDLTSVALHHRAKGMSRGEESELLRRGQNLLFYLLRSPFYEAFFKTRLMALLSRLKSTPVIHLFADALAYYMETWMQLYTYVWHG